MTRLAHDQTELFQPLLTKIWESKKEALIAIAIHDAEESVLYAQAGAKTIADDEIAVAVGSMFGSHGPLGLVIDRFEATGRARDELARVTLEFRAAPAHVLLRIAAGSRYVLSLVYRGTPNTGQRLAIERYACATLAEQLNQVLSRPNIRVP